MQPVLIVGAGPTGLTAAIELRRFGLPVRLIDKSDHPARWSQALIVQSGTLEQWERYGLAAEALSRGTVMNAVHFHEDAKSLARLEFGSHIPGRYPFMLCLPQNDTEELLAGHLRTLGVEIERGVELTAFSNTAAGDAVTAHLRHADDQQERADFRFLLGCDGAHSLVRKDTLTPFTGDTVAERFALGDLDINGRDVPDDELSLYFHRGGWAMLILHLPNGQYRVLTVFPAGQDNCEPKTPTLTDFNADFHRFGLQITATGAGWLAPFSVNERKARHYRHGNTFLLGDAAHIHSPVGGQGMNTGIQDAANLAWKLAAVLEGAPADLLDSYDAERGPVARGVLEGSSIGLRVAGSPNPFVEQVRNFFLKHALASDFIGEKLARGVSETAIQYRNSAIVADHANGGPLRAGDRMPNAERAGGSTLLDPLRQAQHLLVAVDVPSEAVPRHLKHTAVLELASSDTAWCPPLTTLFGQGPLLYLIRPDGYIGFRGTGGKEALRKYANSVGLLSREYFVAHAARVARHVYAQTPAGQRPAWPAEPR